MASDPIYPLFSICAFIGFLISLIPLSWHLQAWNSGTCCYMIWTALACLNQFINSILWANDAIDRAPVWCDISTRITIAASFGIPASSFCIVRRLYKIASSNNVSITRAEKQRAILIDAIIAVLIPLILVPLQYIVEGHRFDIFEEIGCISFVYNTPPAYFISFMWPAVFGVCSGTYAILSFLAFRRRQVELHQFLSSNKSLTIGRYFRLMALAMTETMCTTPLAVVSIVLNATAEPVQPWISWANTHYDFSRVDLVPSLLWKQNRTLVASLQLGRWAPVACAVIFFAFFGFAEEARKNYVALARCIARVSRFSNLLSKIHIPMREKKSPLKPLALSSVHSLPVFIARNSSQKNMSSTSDVLNITFDEKRRGSDLENCPSTPSSATATAPYCMMMTPTSTTFPPTETHVSAAQKDRLEFGSSECRNSKSFHAI